jgi:hypothetical protein
MYAQNMRVVESDLPITRLGSLVDVMHLLSPPAWKIVSLIARDDLMRQSEELNPICMLDRDLRKTTGMVDTSQPTGPEERSGLTLVEHPSGKWTRLSLAQICGGVVDRTKRKAEHRGTGLAKSTAVEAIKEVVQLGIVKKRRSHNNPGRGDLATSYSIDWIRVTELAEESRRWSNVKTTNKFGRPLRQRASRLADSSEDLPQPRITDQMST